MMTTKNNVIKIQLFLLLCFLVVRAQGKDDCPSEYVEYNSTSDSCECKPGFYGWNCHNCVSDAACHQISTSWGCHHGLAFKKDIEMKYYQCTVDPSLESILSDGMIDIECNQTSSACEVAIFKRPQTVLKPHVIDCNITNCSFKENSSDAHCGLIECKCGSDCSSMTKSIVEHTLSGKPVNLTGSGNHISIDIEGSFLPLGATCNASVCAAADGGGGSGSGSGGGGGGDDPISSGVFAAIVAILTVAGLALILAVCCSFFVTSQVKMARQKSVINRSIRGSTDDTDAPGAFFEFKNVSSHVTSHRNSNRGSKETLTILSSVSGSIRRGSLLSLMGPSGSGKTSLLNALAGVRNGKSTVTGQVLVDGENRTDSFRKISAYVQQDDCLFPTLTVRECITYSAYLRLPMDLSIHEKSALVDKVIAELHLEHVSSCKVGVSGGSTRGISGGERRRVSIGMELVTSPRILFLDEATSGLDSFTANSIVSVLKELAQHGRIVIMSIHQPSAKAFKMTDQVLLLGKGHVMFSGNSNAAVAHFHDAGFSCPANENIADYMLDVIADTDNCEMLKSYAMGNLKSDNVELGIDSDTLSNSVRAEQQQQQHTDERSRFNEIQILFERTAKNIIRHNSLLMMHVGISLALAVFGGLIFNHVTNDLAGFQNRSGAFYFILTFFGFASFSSMDIFIAERKIFVRETGAGYYSAFSYFLAKSVLDMISLRVIPATLFASIFYWIMGLQPTVHHFVLFLVTLIIFNVAAGSISVCISIQAPSVGVANLVATVLFLIMLLFGGFLLNVQTMPKYIGWIRHLSIFSYAFEILMTNELKGLVLNFNAPGYPDVPVYGEVFLKTLGMDYKNQVFDLLALGIIAFTFNVMAYLLLALRVPPTASVISDSGIKKYGMRELESL